MDGSHKIFECSLLWYHHNWASVRFSLDLLRLADLISLMYSVVYMVGKHRTADVLPTATDNIYFSVVHHHMTTAYDHLRNTVTLHAFKNVEIYSLVVRFLGDGTSSISIPNHNISIRPNCNGTLNTQSLSMLK